MGIKIVLASTNQGKVREFARLLADPRIELLAMGDLIPEGFSVEETGVTFEENAWLKALAVCAQTGLPSLADDSGLEVDALDGRPGVYSARFAGIGASDQENNRLVLEQLAKVDAPHRTGRFICSLALAIPGKGGPERLASSQGSIEGRLVESERGEGGFGYDPLFEPIAFPGRTTAELSGEEKDRISHRGQAALSLKSAISTWLDSQTLR